MKFLTKASATLLSATLLVSLLAGCGAPKSDPIQEALGYSGDTVFATFSGKDITAEDYLPWLANYVSYMNNMYQMMGQTGVDWDEDVGDGKTARDYMKEQALESVKLIYVMEGLAEKEGVKLSDADKKAVQEQRSATVESLGGEEAYTAYLKSMCLTEESMDRINSVDALSVALEEKLCGEGKRFVANDETLRAYMDERKILKAKHILLLTKDPALDGGAYSDEKKAEQRKKADDILAQLRAAEDPITLFDTLMNGNSEDSGLQGNPDGYLFSTNPDGVDFTSRMVPEFEEGTAALDYNQISEIVESEHGYHIILRLDPLADETSKTEYTDKWYGAQIDGLYQEQLDTLEVKTTEAYDKLNAQEFFETLTAYTKTLEDILPKPEGDPATPTGDPATPTGDPATPTGDPATPAGDPATPAGDPATPAGDPATPAGDPATPAGDPATPENKTTDTSQ